MAARTIIILVSIWALPAAADKLKKFEFAGSDSAGQPAVCEFVGTDFSDDVVVYGAGKYSGRKLNVQIDQSGHVATQFDIAVNVTDRPVALFLGAYEPTIWNIGWTRNTNIVAVYATGYHRQVVAGIESDTPVLISTHDNKGPCGYTYVGKNRNTGLNTQSRRLFGQPISLVYPGDENGNVIVGEALPSNPKLVTSRKNTPESYLDADQPLAGRAGLEDAVRRGIIRPATPADIDAWVAGLEKKGASVDIPPVAGIGVPRPSRPRLRNAYLVLKEFRYPAGLYGAHSATFFVASGVPRPTGNPGHSLVYDFNSFSCQGAGCGRR